MSGEERLDLGLNRLHQHAPGAILQHGQQRVVRDARSWSRQGDNAILLHGVSSRVTSSITEDTPPPASATKFSYSPSQLGEDALRFGNGRSSEHRGGYTVVEPSISFSLWFLMR
jgi:hypothetical protein